MNINSIDRQMFSSYPNYARSIGNKDNQYKFKDVFAKKNREDIIERFHNYSKGISVPAILSDKLNPQASSVFEDVTYNEEYLHLQDCGPKKVFRTYFDNLEGDGGKAWFVITLSPCSMDAKIEGDKLQDIFDKSMTIVNKMMPIYQKMSDTSILAGVSYGLPFDEASGKVDFNTFAKDMIECTSGLVMGSDLDDETKEELQRMLKECEDFLLKALDDNAEKETKANVAEKSIVSIEYRNKLD